MTVYIRTNDAAHPIVEYDEDICPHGMSMWLCAHPIYHYPTDEMMMNGRYY